MYCVYRHTTPSNKVYIGITKQKLHEAAKAVGASASNICNCCKGKKKTIAGYHWQYAGGES